VLIRLDDGRFVDDLCVHFERSGFAVQRVGGTMVDVQRVDAPSPEQARREVLMHLRIWSVLNPQAQGDLV
jgi:hypothetical protein